MYQFQIHKLFPTTAIKFDVSDVITQDHKSNMIRDIDDMEQNNLYLQLDDGTPRLQSLPVLFHPNYPYADREYWKCLQETFVHCCYQYLQTVENFCNNQGQLEYTGCRAWFYKNNSQISAPQKNPPHNHFPSFLTGVFYLEIPGDGTTGGTELCDPRGPAERATRMVEIMPTPLSWLIFPGWMEHVSGRQNTRESRYVIAADCYVKVM
jgi:hypothetical protein